MLISVTYFPDVTNRYNQILRLTSCLVNKLLNLTAHIVGK